MICSRSWVLPPLSLLRDIDPTYSALFEFTGSSDTSFRLETRFKEIPGCAELEVSNSQWFRARSKSDGTPDRMALQIGMVNFMRSDWQIDNDFFESIDKDDPSITKEMKKFAGEIMLGVTNSQCHPPGVGKAEPS